MVTVCSEHLGCLSTLGSFADVREHTARNSVGTHGTFSCTCCKTKKITRGCSLSATCSVFHRNVSLVGGSKTGRIPKFILSRFFGVSCRGCTTSPGKFHRHFLASCLRDDRIYRGVLNLTGRTTAPRTTGGVITRCSPALRDVRALFTRSGTTGRRRLITVFAPGIRTGGSGLTCLGSTLALLSTGSYSAARICFGTTRCTCGVRPDCRSTVKATRGCCGRNGITRSIRCCSGTLRLYSASRGETTVSLGVTSTVTGANRRRGTLACLSGTVRCGPTIANGTRCAHTRVTTSAGGFGSTVRCYSVTTRTSVDVSKTTKHLGTEVRRIRHGATRCRGTGTRCGTTGTGHRGRRGF